MVANWGKKDFQTMAIRKIFAWIVASMKEYGVLIIIVLKKQQKGYVSIWGKHDEKWYF